MTAIPIELPREVSTFRGINLSNPAFKARTELAKHGDVQATDSILDTILKPGRIAQLKEIYKKPENIVWIPMSALVDGKNLLPYAFTQELQDSIGGKAISLIKPKEKRSLPHRLVKQGYIRLAKEARVNFEVEPGSAKLLKDKTIILVDDQFKTGGTVRDAIASLAEEGIKVSEVRTLGAGRSIEFAPKPEILEASIKETLGPERVSIIEEQTNIPVKNLTSAELSSINRIAKETKTLEGFKNELKRINEEYAEAGRRYRLELGEAETARGEISERIIPYQAAQRPSDKVTLPQKPHPELREPQSKFGTEPTSAEIQQYEIEKHSERAAYFQKMEDRSKAEAERQTSPEKKALWLEHAEDMRKEKTSCKIKLEAALEKKEAVAAVTKENFLKLRKAEIDKLAQLKFPFKAQFMDERITVLGSIDDFEPYKTARKQPKRDITQLMVRRPDGSRAIMMAAQIHVAGKPLVTPTPQGLFPPMWKPPGAKAQELGGHPELKEIPKELKPSPTFDTRDYKSVKEFKNKGQFLDYIKPQLKEVNHPHVPGSKTVRPYVVGYGCDGSTDANIHYVAQKMTKALGFDYEEIYDKAYPDARGEGWIENDLSKTKDEALKTNQVKDTTIIPKNATIQDVLDDLYDVNNRSLVTELEETFEKANISLETKLAELQTPDKTIKRTMELEL